MTDLSQPISEQAPVAASGRGAAPPVPAARSAQDDASDFPFAIALGEIYEGPLDLLLDLIRKQDINIYDIPIARITAQYLTYVERIRELDVNVASEFIYMAAVLIHIKSKMLLPRDPLAPADAPEDPRNELVNRLLEHEKFKSAAQMLLQKQQIEDAVLSNPAIREFVDAEGAEPELAADVIDLVKTFQQILDRARNRPILEVDEETVTVGPNDSIPAQAAFPRRSSHSPEADSPQCTVAAGAGLHVSGAARTGAVAGDPGAAGSRFRRSAGA